MSEVLFATALVNPDQTVTLRFKAPSEPGEYPYICTFPGHWRIMQGVMKVVPN
ncbi:plastocyanin/azurin family copper-binding protein [Maribacter litopenaei]|uniref:plastocyanin/azurin family copper-binding protein n=1 Tax=Maribacter litopenaei TaxID=2976127 RepID=UPI003B84B09D